MDFNRRTDILQTDDNISMKVPVDPADRHEQGEEATNYAVN